MFPGLRSCTVASGCDLLFAREGEVVDKAHMLAIVFNAAPIEDAGVESAPDEPMQSALADLFSGLIDECLAEGQDAVFTGRVKLEHQSDNRARHLEI